MKYECIRCGTTWGDTEALRREVNLQGLQEDIQHIIADKHCPICDAELNTEED
jgi:hypothetical protein